MSQDPERESRAEKPPITQVRIDRQAPVDLKSRFVDDLVVQNRPEYFILTFSEIQFPMLIGSDEEKEQILESLKSIPAKPVVRLVVTPGIMSQFIKVMTENLEEYEQTRVVFKELEGEESEDE